MKLRPWCQVPDGSHDVATGMKANDADQTIGYVQGWKSAFPDMISTVDSAYESENTVIMECSWTGTHTGDMMTPDGNTIPPTNKTVNLKNVFITEFDDNFNIIRNIQSDKINITEDEWEVFNPKIYEKNNYILESEIVLKTNFDSDRIQTLYSNLSALNFFEIYELRNNYKKLKYSITDVDLHLLKLISYPFYLVLMALFSALIMLQIKKSKILQNILNGIIF